MIHALELPEITLERLKDVVLLQMGLLYHAACQPAISEATVANCLKTVRRFTDNSEEIAHWFWERGTTTRHTHLEEFAKTYCEGTSKRARDVEQQAKKDWCLRLIKEVTALLSKDKKPICIQPYIEEDIYSSYYSTSNKDGKPVHWRTRAKKFLLYFYETCLEGNEAFPGYFFSEPGAKKFGRQDLLKAFIEKNPEQEICAVCNEARYYSQGDRVHTHLDHYLPKSLYPHFACHPYNLVPICYFCNSPIKGESDPFCDYENKTRRATLHKETFPYHHFGLSQATYLKVKAGVKAELVEIQNIEPRPDLAPQDIQIVDETIKLMQELYNIPGRWQDPDHMLRISDTLFRRMRHFIGDGQGIITGSDMKAEVYNALKQLLYYLDRDDQQKDPFAFAMTWILGVMMQEEDPRALVEEVNSWTGQSLKESQQRDEHAEQLLKIVQKSRSKEA